MKKNIHDVESRNHTAQRSYVPGTRAAEQCKFNAPVNLLYRGSRIGLFALLMFVSAFTATGFTNPICTIPFSITRTTNIIVMEGDVIRANTEDEEIEITELRVYNSSLQLVYRKTDCNSSVCEVYAGNFNSGSYLVVAVTTENQAFSEYVFVN